MDKGKPKFSVAIKFQTMSMIDSIVQKLWAKKSVFWSKMTLFGPKKRFLALKIDEGPT